MKIGIPTMYRGVQFRSRLEAKWAVFFDLVGWPWLYEPLYLRGYVPDFVLQLHQPVLVEVKPALSRADMGEAVAKIDRSGWEREAIVVGVSPGVLASDHFSGTSVLGLLREVHNEDGWHEHDWSTASILLCPKCNRMSFLHDTCWWGCRVSGCYDGDGYVQWMPVDTVKGLWNRASNHVQWRGSQGLPDVRGS